MFDPVRNFLLSYGDPGLVVDVAHNPQAARTLAAWLHAQDARTFAVFGALADKDVGGIADALRGRIDGWFLAGLERDSPRGLDAAAVRDALVESHGAPRIEAVCADVAGALAAAFARAERGDRIVAFGSFFVAAAALQFAAARQLSPA